MSHGTVVGFAHPIKGAQLARLFPEQWGRFAAALEAIAVREGDDPLAVLTIARSKGVLMCEAAEVLEEGDEKEAAERVLSQNVLAKLRTLQDAFSVRFFGLILELGQHTKGDAYDEVDGAYWDVHGLFAPTKGHGALCEALSVKEIERKFFTEQG